ncbi:Arm DNA-binding domain-containing protein [Rhodoferax ferrireducens]|uniref:Arm DNA-binding domain-containing protein n=1 Tax=Rhodoferax ferrireducens TaxID=192843 RepID=UPI000E0D5493|nr:site-specific integrase [Rhodoferax ferrireducens]
MPSIRSRVDNDLLFFDFRYDGARFREQTLLHDTPANRKKLEKALAKIESEIAAGTFNYASCFPNSKALKRLAQANVVPEAAATPVAQAVQFVANASTEPVDAGPLFKDFASQWVDEHNIEWRRSHIRSLLSTLNGRLIPHFGGKAVGSISKSDILVFRATLAKVKGRGQKEGLSPKRINEIIGLLRQILSEAADRFQFTSPALNIKTLRLRKTDVAPFSLVDVQRMLATVRSDFKDYFTVRFFTGMRTGEVHGLKWKYVDFDLRILRVRETFVLGEDEYTKTDGSQRDIQMSQPVFDALQRQQAVTGKASDYVFCNLMGQPLDNKNFSDRIWYPLLRHLDLDKRRPYQMRHTAATLWLASGEAPEWIARQLGHTSTEMLFRVYSRYVPNLTRQDGSAMERLLASQLSQGALLPQKQQGHAAAIYVPARDIAPQPIPKLRGIHGSNGTPAPSRGVAEIRLAPSSREGAGDHDAGTGPERAQPPPGPWLVQSVAWMPSHAPLQLN